MLWDRYCLIAAVHCIVGWILSDSNSSLHCGINIVSQLQFIALRDKYCLTAAVHYIASYLIIGVNGFFLHSSRDGSPLNAPAHPLLSPLLHRDPPEDPLNHLRPLSERPHQVSSGHSVWFLLYLVHITVITVVFPWNNVQYCNFCTTKHSGYYNAPEIQLRSLKKIHRCGVPEYTVQLWRCPSQLDKSWRTHASNTKCCHAVLWKSGEAQWICHWQKKLNWSEQ